MLYLKFRRLQLGLTQREVRRRAGGVVNHSNYSQIETGRVNPRPIELVQLAKVLLVPNPPDLLRHVDCTALGPAAEFRDQQREPDAAVEAGAVQS